MNYIDYTLKFNSKAEADSVFYLNDESLFPECSIDYIGVIQKNGTDIQGWHVNVRGPLTPEIEQYNVDVQSPVRVWA